MKEFQLGDLLDNIVGGGTPSKRNNDFWNGGTIPWASVKDMPDGKFRIKETEDHITEKGLQNSSSNLIPKGTVITSTRMGLGRSFINEVDMAINQDLKALFPNGKLHNKFLLWWLASKANELESIGTGTTVKGIRLEQLRALKINLPDLQIQQKIASILSAFDDLISNNTRRIEILEEMARRIYREWFVHFRYPGHEEDDPSTGSGQRLVDSGTDLGEIPGEWEVKKIGEICELMYSGGTPLRRENKFWEKGTIKWFKTKELQDNFLFEAEEKINELAVKNSSAKEFPKNTILMAIYGSPTVGRLGITTERSSCNQAALGMIANNEYCSQTYLYYVLYNYREYFNTISQGAAQQNISKTIVNNTDFLLAPKELIDKFDEIVQPIIQLKKNLTKKNIQLKKTRDFLLPKLISGKIDVEELELESVGT